MADEFKIGDVVRLKSGSPEMTIEDIGAYGMGSQKVSAKCIWFEGNKLKEGVFALETLRFPNTPSEVRLVRG